MGSNSTKVIFQMKSLSCPAEAPSQDESPSPGASVTIPLPSSLLPPHHSLLPHSSWKMPALLSSNYCSSVNHMVNFVLVDWQELFYHSKNQWKSKGQILPTLVVAVEWGWSGGEVGVEWGSVQEGGAREERWQRIGWSGVKCDGVGDGVGWSGGRWLLVGHRKQVENTGNFEDAHRQKVFFPLLKPEEPWNPHQGKSSVHPHKHHMATLRGRCLQKALAGGEKNPYSIRAPQPDGLLAQSI